MTPAWRNVLSVCIAAVCLSGCSRDFRVRPVAPAPTATAASLPASTSAPRLPDDCLEALRSPSASPGARAARNAATERLLTLAGPALLAAAGHTVHLQTESGQPFTLTLRRGSGRGGVNPSEYVALDPSDAFAVDHVDHFSRVAGEGVPVAGSLRPVYPVNSPGTEPPQPVSGLVRALTVVANVRAPRPITVELALYDPHTASRRLAADFTTPLALELAHFRPQRRGLRGLMHGGDYFASTGLYALETPTPDKTPLVLVHGLISDPGDFYHLYNDLAANDAVRRRYQFWVFYYPTSLPVAYAAMLLREDVDRFIHQLDPAGTHPPLHRAVLVGHSMGGLLCRLAISQGGDRYYHHFFSEPIDQLMLSKDDRSLARRAFYSPGTANVAQVVFIATPHRGSRLASGPLGGLGRVLLHMPSTLRERLRKVLAQNQRALAPGHPVQPGSSLDSLTPDGPVIAAVNDLPMRPGVRLHSIIGDRGRGGPREQSSDGVVPYASSHLPQAESEVVVPASHTGTLKRPETSAELIRILGG